MSKMKLRSAKTYEVSRRHSSESMSEHHEAPVLRHSQTLSVSNSSTNANLRRRSTIEGEPSPQMNPPQSEMGQEEMTQSSPSLLVVSGSTNPNNCSAPLQPSNIQTEEHDDVPPPLPPRRPRSQWLVRTNNSDNITSRSLTLPRMHLHAFGDNSNLQNSGVTSTQNVNRDFAPPLLFSSLLTRLARQRDTAHSSCPSVDADDGVDATMELPLLPPPRPPLVGLRTNNNNNDDVLISLWDFYNRSSPASSGHVFSSSPFQNIQPHFDDDPPPSYEEAMKAKELEKEKS